MEERIKAYEKFMKEKTSEKLGPIERAKVIEYNREIMMHFQWERIAHLIVMFFFVALSLGLISVLTYACYQFGWVAEMIPFYVLTAIVFILTACYVKHYYFLENHIQGLYKYTKKLIME